MNNVYQTAIDLQNACNLSGLAQTLAQMTTEIWEEARENGEGTEYVNRHPAVVLMLAQMLALSTGEELNPQTYHDALEACKQRLQT